MQQGPGLGVVAAVRRGVFDDFVAQGETAVVETLTQQDDVGQGVVDGQDDHGGEDALEDGAKDVEDVAGQPDDDEDDR